MAGQVAPQAQDITSLSNEDLMAMAGGQQAQPETGLNADLQKEGANLYDIWHSQGSIPRNIARSIGTEAGVVGDIAGKAGSLAMEGAFPQLGGASPKQLFDIARVAIPGVNRAVEGAKQTIAPIAQQYQQNLNTYNKENPESGLDFQAVRNMANVLPLGVEGAAPLLADAGKEAITTAATGAAKGLELGAQGVAKGAEVGAETAGKIANVLKTKPIPTSEDIKGIASAAYKNAEDKGGILKPEVTDEFLGHLDDIKPKPIAGKVLTSEDKQVLNSIGDFDALKGQPLSLNDVQRLDESLSAKIDTFIDPKTGAPNKTGRQIMDVQDKLRQLVDSADESKIIGGKEGFDSLKEGRALWSTAMRIGDMERIQARAAMYDNPATSLKAGFRTLYNNPNRMRGYNTAEKAAIKRAAESGIVSDTLRTVLGSRLLAMIGGATGGGTLGAIASIPVSAASRNMALSLQTRRANQAMKEVAKRIPNKNPWAM